MILRHHEITTPDVSPPAPQGWVQLPTGYYRLEKCLAPDRLERDEEVARRRQEAGVIAPGQFQQDCLLSILADMKRETVHFFELGAGWGRISLMIAGAVDFHLVESPVRDYRCLAVEAETTHFGWLREQFQAQHIKGTAVYGAVSKKNGTCRFDTGSRPDYEYGQSISAAFSRRGLPRLAALKKMFTGGAVKVPMYTIDRLMTDYGYEQVDIIQMDVQGAEYDAALGAAAGIREGRIGYFLINTHTSDNRSNLRAVFGDAYDLVIDLPQNEIGHVPGFPPIQCRDGIQLYKRKGL